jgi:hypothetical protein
VPGLLRGRARGGLLVNGVRPCCRVSRARPGLWLSGGGRGLFVSRVRPGLWLSGVRPGLLVSGVRPGLWLSVVTHGLLVSRVRPGLWLSVVTHGLAASRVKDALGHAHQVVGAFPDLVELVEKPLDPVLEPFHGILARIGTAVVAAGRLGRPRGPGRCGRPGRRGWSRRRGGAGRCGWSRRRGWPGRRGGSIRVVVPTAGEVISLASLLLIVEYPFGLGRLLRRVGGSLGGVRGFLRRLDLPLGRLGSAASLIGGGPGLIGPAQGAVDFRFVRPLLRHIGGFLGQVGGLLRRVGGLFQPFSALSRPVGPLARPVGQAPGPVGRLPGVEAGLLLVVELGIARVGFPGHGAGPVVTTRRRVMALILDGMAGVLDGTARDAIRFAGLGHALADGGLPGLVRSHDQLFPGGTARVCPPW